MKTRLLFLILLLSTTLIFAQAPVVENVSFVQRTDGSLKVDIYYDLSDGDGENKQIVVEASSDNGATWTLNCASLTGDVGSGISPGTGKHVEWDFYTDNPNTSGSTYKVRVTALETGTVTDVDGNVYQTVKIGTQWWMAENLKVTKYRTGETIATNINDADWAIINIGAYCVYGRDESNADTYGYLYNWAAVSDSRNLAPTGWHVPTDAELSTLSTYLGGDSVAGGKLKSTGTIEASTGLWDDPNTGATNETGFSALPGGYRSYAEGYFYSLGSRARFWSAYEYSSNYALYLTLRYLNSDIYWNSSYKQYGFSVRCVKD
ncbi:fibrobacter succinogenes major paralogous domain-containing protein [candidate division KSB1 bacterium]|nr:fibrobacter succinogenes major paralogous domain-containing protein [candidate division KSB1 bacterium]